MAKRQSKGRFGKKLGDRIRDKVREWGKALGGAIFPEPSPAWVPIPVRTGPRRPPRQH
jgi:hypothetical protein